ncbi:unnamed protein product [Gongylonema pulchrum]|uniref:G_PROTEIN_RECEP_F1_2 domain-containing protein n=1 Tax=Gongylonema pulchrum TaxID=637853 RepID=A0A183D6X1_9BILA|nr:unnamed protein product [Gongylonema pulchrum]
MNISCVITLIFYVTPMCTRLLIVDVTDTTLVDVLIVYSGISCTFNPLAILAALFIMQEDVKAAVHSSLPNCLHWLIQHQPPSFVSGTLQGDKLTTANHEIQKKHIMAAFFSRLPQWTKKTAVQSLSKSATSAQP